MNLAAFRVPVSDFRSPASGFRDSEKCGHRNSGESESGGTFFDRITSEFRNSETRVTGFLIFFPEHPVYPVQKWDFLYYQDKTEIIHIDLTQIVQSRL
jgi:hypothetical protein